MNRVVVAETLIGPEFSSGAIYIGIQIVLSSTETMLGVLRVRGPIADFLDAHQSIEHGIVTIDDWLFPAAPAVFDAMWIARVLAVAAIAIALACVAFSRREVPHAGE